MDVTEQSFENEVILESHARPVIVDFWASWCGPCRTLGPILEEVEKQLSGKVLLAKVNTETETALASRFHISSIPDVRLFYGGKEVDSFVGALPAAQILSWLDPWLPNPEIDQASQQLKSGNVKNSLAAFQKITAKGKRYEDLAAALFTRLVATHQFTDAELVLKEIPLGSKDYTDFRQGWDYLFENRNQYDTLPQLIECIASGNQVKLSEYLETVIEKVRNLENKDLNKEIALSVFRILGDSDPVTVNYRVKLHRALY